MSSLSFAEELRQAQQAARKRIAEENAVKQIELNAKLAEQEKEEQRKTALTEKWYEDSFLPWFKELMLLAASRNQNFVKIMGIGCETPPFGVSMHWLALELKKAFDPNEFFIRYDYENVDGEYMDVGDYRPGYTRDWITITWPKVSN